MQPTGVAWRPEDPEQAIARTEDVYKPDILKVIETRIDDLTDDLTRLSLDISGMPRSRFQRLSPPSHRMQITLN
jgi:hypothetical protein